VKEPTASPLTPPPAHTPPSPAGGEPPDNRPPGQAFRGGKKGESGTRGSMRGCAGPDLQLSAAATLMTVAITLQH
jgi:hypothetical protein